ncbi:hypothetical protein EDD66_10681 [Mobilisporobacter senegalensis]|uniref:Uncharacterized protein n=1 Tax=Mobilisporobacter senegalensis TaxID=1329262 RepID=A0A3N1XKZ1_9FIRM|nr:hypothetical protein [Mobilisporobacter senegalensis]ROR27384.1 hypothetical protein EDD66_10681 [Mobilisporobacter senegalensis]
MKNKKNTLWYSLQHPEPVVYDERMEAIENRSYIWGFHIYTIIITSVSIFIMFSNSDENIKILFMFLLSVRLFIELGKTLYRCYYGILEVDNKKRSGMFHVLNGCIASGVFTMFYIVPFSNYISKLWYIVVFVVGFAVFYGLCHITYAQYLKSNEDDFNERKKEHSQTIGILCAIVLGIFLIGLGPVVNLAIDKDRIINTFTKEEADALGKIQKASDAYYNLDVYKLECFYSISKEDNKPVYSNLIPGHSYYWQGSKESFALILDDNNSNNPVFQANYLRDKESNQEWNIYHDGKWFSEMDYIQNPDIPGDVDERYAIMPVTGILDIDPKSVEDISIESNENGYRYTVTFNEKYMKVEEYLGRTDKVKSKRHAVEIYTVNDFGVMTGYELKLTTYDEDTNEPTLVRMRFNLLSVDKDKINGEIKELVSGKFDSYTKSTK